MTSTHSVNRLMARHEQHLQWLFLGHQHLSRQWLQQQAASDPEFADWLALRLRVPRPPQRMEQMAPHLRQQLTGWRLYYQGEYHRAAEQFQLAAPMALNEPDNPCAIDLALGLGKVYTRTGHWGQSRDWILYSLALARAQYRLFAVTEGYGALGELLLRAGHPQAAQACMSSAYQLLPPGSGQQAKQLNFLASALLRNGAALRAESLLMTALHMAHDQNDADSAWHALARLQFLQLQGDGGYEVTQRLQSYLPATRTAVACGLLQIGRALWQVRQGDAAAAAHSLDQALADLGPQLPLERLWAQRLRCALLQQPYSPEAAGHRWADIVPVPAPTTTPVLDLTWARLPLPSGNGFACLLQPLGSLEQEAQARTVFFI